MQKLKAIWDSLSGLKTMIAAMYWGCAMPSLAVLYGDGVPPNIFKWVTIVGFFLTATGLGDKWYKKYRTKQDEEIQP
jgi:hypothetical protein